MVKMWIFTCVSKKERKNERWEKIFREQGSVLGTLLQKIPRTFLFDRVTKNKIKAIFFEVFKHFHIFFESFDCIYTCTVNPTKNKQCEAINVAWEFLLDNMPFINDNQIV